MELLHICATFNHHCIFLCWIPPWRWPKMAETCRRCTNCVSLYLNIDAVVGVYGDICYCTKRG